MLSRFKYNRKAHTTHVKDTRGAPGSGDPGDVPQDTYHLRPPGQAWETQQIYPIETHTEAGSQNEEQKK